MARPPAPAAARELTVRLLVVTPWPLASRGGGQRLVAEIAAALTAHYRIDVVVAAGTGLALGPEDLQPVSSVREVRLPLVRPADGHWRFARRAPAPAVLQGLDAMAERIRPDALLYVPHFSPCALQARAIAARLGIPFLLWPAIHLDVRAHTSRAAAAFYRSAAMVWCLSEAERRWLVREAGVPPHRAVTLGFGWHGAVHPWKGRSPDRSRMELLTVGAYVPHKQLDHQVQALALLRSELGVHARLTVAGARRDRSVLDKLRSEIGRCRLEHAVELRVDCRDAEIDALHARADYFLFTSRSESFGVAILESMAAATPPVVYPHPIYRELIESSGVGTIAAEPSPRALAHALVQAIHTPCAPSDERRRAWFDERSWQRVLTPLADALTSPRACLV